MVGKEPPADQRAWVRAEWQLQADAQQSKAQRFAEERLLGPVRTWPGYFDIEARLTIEVARLVEAARLWSADDILVEHWMQDDVLGLEGKPDLVVAAPDGSRLVDFKSGRPGPADALPGSSYASQLAIYSALLRSTGITLSEAAIQPLGLASLSVSVTENDEAEVAERARGLAARFNEALAEGREAELGSPSDDACGWCPHAAHCPALWESLEAFASMHSIEGDVVAVKQSARGASVRVAVERGTTAGVVTVVQLRPVGAVADARIGDRIRVAGLVATDRSDVLSARRGGWVRADVTDRSGQAQVS
jgi:RecB family exonuclease